MSDQAWLITLGVMLVIWAWWRFYYFFRDPPRTTPPGTHLVAPADGRIVYQELVDFDRLATSASPPPWEEYVARVRDAFAPAGRWRVSGTYLSIFDVHVVRSPATGAAKMVTIPPRGGQIAMQRPLMAAMFGRMLPYPGRAYAAKNALVAMEIAGESPVIVVIMADWWIRQIEMFAKDGGTVERGRPIGRIHMGSQVDVWVPEKGPPFTSAIGDRVIAGETTITT